MLSYWENVFYKCDLVIIGGGITGLSTAISLKLKNPKLSITVLEKDTIPSSASTRNAGFACFGSFTELLSDSHKLGTEGMLSLVEKRWSGLRLLTNRLGQDLIEYENYGGYEILGESQLHLLEQLEHLNNSLKSIFSEDVFRIDNEKISQFGFNNDWCRSIVFNPLEGQLHSGKMIKSLNGLATHIGIEIYNGVEARALHEENEKVRIDLNDKLSMTCGKVVLCNNAWASQFTNEDIKPGRGIVMITEQMDIPFKGTFHFDEGYYYFRNIDNRLLIGGGRNIDYKSEETFNKEINPKIKSDLMSKAELVLNGKPFSPSNWWAGIMAFGSDKSPIVKKVGQNIWIGARLSGMGVALASQIGEELALKISEDL